jgi:lipopolysaccharide transport system ATP-binding protein
MLSETSAGNIVGLSEVPRNIQENEIAISARNLGKCYAIYNTPKDKLKEVLCFGRRNYHRDFWALRDISFDIRRGETVGIIGRNGSGKSTLLQILCGTLAPTVGTVEIRGRVSALLELGSGFNPEFTGKENVYMNAAILGLSKEEIDSRYQSIVDFADIGDFVDQPVKKYSSGMYVRLAFATAINVDPDILVVDELLAVGDEVFQGKCFAKIRSIRERGGTILFVSHSTASILELCDRACLVDRGEALMEGHPKLVLSKYQQLAFAAEEHRGSVRDGIRLIRQPKTRQIDHCMETSSKSLASDQCVTLPFYDVTLVPEDAFSYSSRGARISEARITTLDGEPVNNLLRRESYIFAFTVDFEKTALSVRAGFLVKTVRGLELGGTATSSSSDAIPVIGRGVKWHVRFKFTCILLPGTYLLNAGVEGVVDGEKTYLARCVDACIFRVLGDGNLSEHSIVDFCCEVSSQFESS